MAPTTQNSDIIEISDDDSDLYQEWDETKLIGAFLEARWAIRTKLENFRECHIWSEHIGTKSGNFVRTYCPDFWKF